MSRIPENILQAGCNSYADTIFNGNGSHVEGIEAAYFAINEHDEWDRASPPAWNGEGLPPAGTVCTVESDDPHNHWEAHCGKQVEIIAHAVSETNSPVAVYKVLIDGCAEYHGLVASCFRPIKTPEQIAAEDMAATVKDMIEVTSDDEGCIDPGYAELLWKAGYRKQEAP